MRTGVSIIIQALLFFSPLTAKPGISVNEQLIAAEQRVIWEAVQRKQLRVLKDSLAEDYLDVSDVGVYTKTETLNLIPDLTLRDYKLSNFRVMRTSTTVAIVTYEATQHWTIKGQAGTSHVRATSVWVKRRGKWLIAFHQESTMS